MTIVILVQGGKMGRLGYVAGTEIVDDIRLGHTWSEFYALRDFIKEKNPKNFIEIGVHEGGLSYLLLPLFPTMHYVGIELNCGVVRPRVRIRYKNHPSAMLLCEDCFGYAPTIQVQNLNNKIVYCDGGNKAKELKHYKSVCRPGDIIMAHDYQDGIRVVPDIVPEEMPKAEVTPEDIKHLEEDKNFVRIDEGLENTRIIAFERKLVWVKRNIR